ncbi:XrtA system polysaccharide chain length determinant [Sulfurirhabdus autotrophica]|uniref:Polysaccharide chain length determinant protein (PEP-CTERM system associated) n=1 Tax=Sulfurirhabdus autotrophica TaxID=1706046 RepID=A0A4R3YAV7_9PROT|nr:XrtA system polysaccharide chain length determinant [Sulfurirhabdus autotrophica]TCV88158.1 polysaccharide chain length determinant protein (PEP-CTERM system associated) [Sulfurirhabdus autotrophica]
MHETLAQLLTYLKATWRRRWYAIIVAWLVSAIGWAWVYTLPDRYEASARVYVDTQSLLKPLLAGLTVNPNVGQQINMITRTLLSRPNLEKVTRMTDQDLNAKDPAQMEQLLNQLSSQIELQGTDRENLYTISYQNQKPEVAKRVVQSLLTIFVESSLGTTRKDIASSQKFIEDQLKSQEQKLIAAESAITDFKRNHMGLMPGEGGGYYAKLAEMSNALNQAKLDLREAEDRRDQLKRQLSDEDPNATTTVVTSSDPELDARIESLKKNMDGMRLQYTELHPDIVATKRLIAQLEAQKKEDASKRKPGNAAAQSQNPVYQQLSIALSEADANAASLRARVAEYEKRFSQLKAAANSVPEVEAQYTQLTRDYEVYKSNYASLLARRETASMSSEVENKADTVDIRVIDPPRVPLTPAWPNRIMLMSFVLLGGLGAGIAVAFLISQLRRTVDDRVNLREISGLPLLGAVSRIETPDSLKKKRKKLFAYGLSVASLLGVYGVLITLQMVMAR